MDRKLFTYRIANNNTAVRRMKNAKVCMVLFLSTIILTTLGFATVDSLLSSNAVIATTGRVSTTPTPLTHYSEMRGIFVHCASFPADWTAIASTLAQYKINSVFGEFLTSWGSQYNYLGQLSQAIPALHSRGIQVYVAMSVLSGTWTTGTGIVDSTGTYDDGWTCPSKQASRDIIKTQVENVARNYNIDGFMFDYIRYDGGGMCYCNDCKAKFITDTGLSGVNWPADVLDGGRYYGQFMEWRTVPITELVRDMKNWMLAINPNLQFTIASWWIQSPSSPSYWRRWVGQDTALWVYRNYLDSVAPMQYTNSPTGFADDLRLQMNYFTGGSEGKIPFYALITTSQDASSNPYTGMDPLTFKAIVEEVRLSGADGWIIWAYGGPGDNRGFPDIRNYLGQISLPETFEINNIKVSISQNSATFTWDTSQSTSGKVEYSTSPLFTAAFIHDSTQNFDCYDINYVQGTIINEQGNKTSHSVVINNLLVGQTYYFRVQSQGSTGICTSEVLTFTLG